MITAQSKKRWTSATVVVLFFAALWTPLIGTFFGAGNFLPDEEHRSLAQWPVVRTNWFDFARGFTAWFDDHFGFRGTLITAQALLKVKILGVSSWKDVVIGKDGWLYYTGEKSMDDYRGVLPFAAGELEDWVRFFQGYNDWLERRGIPFLVLIAPDKQSVYPEFLPKGIRKVTGSTRLDELTLALKGESNLRVVDLRSALREAKGQYSELYYRTDTHWSASGAYIAYREIIRRVEEKYPAIRALPYNYPSYAGNYDAGDETKMLGLPRVWREVPPHLPLSLPNSQTPEGYLLVLGPNPASPRIAILGDSFLFPLVDYLAQTFAATIVSRSGVLNTAMIDKYHPDIVLFEIVERKLNLPLTGTTGTK
jgi:alginate O-acetyltransferase complex protein AlgJ